MGGRGTGGGMDTGGTCADSQHVQRDWEEQHDSGTPPHWTVAGSIKLQWGPFETFTGSINTTVGPHRTGQWQGALNYSGAPLRRSQGASTRQWDPTALDSGREH